MALKSAFPLRKLDRAESALKALGFEQRVRDYGEVARLEFDLEQLSVALERKLKLSKPLKLSVTNT